VNVTAVGGDRGTVVVDTLGSARAAAGLVDDLRRLFDGGPGGPNRGGELLAVVNTHQHWDHTFGNGTLRDAFPGVPVHAHEAAAAATSSAGVRAKQQYAARPDDPHAAEVLDTEVLPADRTFSSAAVLDLGDRTVELVHPGLGHTAGDLVVVVPDADVVLAGDLVEESAPPSYGPDCFPLEWPATLDLVTGLLRPGTVVVPGHGAVVDTAFVQQQRADVGVVAETIADLASRMVPLAEALDAADWPFPPDLLGDAVRRGYDQVPRESRRLPLV
jgi:glyoxylase-like metal-dependent hydrolase (beta-lactamase superfamily II)